MTPEVPVQWYRNREPVPPVEPAELLPEETVDKDLPTGLGATVAASPEEADSSFAIGIRRALIHLTWQDGLIQSTNTKNGHEYFDDVVYRLAATYPIEGGPRGYTFDTKAFADKVLEAAEAEQR